MRSANTIKTLHLHYSFGMLMPDRSFSTGYRFGFNGMEKDDEVKGAGNSLDFGARIYDSRLGRWLSLDPLVSDFPQLSPYSAMGNNPSTVVDIEGKYIAIYVDGNCRYFWDDGRTVVTTYATTSASWESGIKPVSWPFNGLIRYESHFLDQGLRLFFFNSNKNSAEKFASQVEKSVPNHPMLVDAARHTWFMAQNTDDYNGDVAREFGVLHEIAGLPGSGGRGVNSEEDRTMDLKNNQWAINYVEKLKEGGGELNFYQFFDAFKTAVNSGEIELRDELKPTENEFDALKSSLFPSNFEQKQAEQNMPTDSQIFGDQ